MPVHYDASLVDDENEPAWIVIALAGPPVEVTWTPDLEDLADVINDVHDGNRQAIRRFLARLTGDAGQDPADSKKVTVHPGGEDAAITFTLTAGELLRLIRAEFGGDEKALWQLAGHASRPRRNGGRGYPCASTAPAP